MRNNQAYVGSQGDRRRCNSHCKYDVIYIQYYFIDLSVDMATRDRLQLHAVVNINHYNSIPN